MAEIPKSLRRELREVARRAYDAELSQALAPLADAFDAWRTGKLSPAKLVEQIHDFHDGVNRQIWKRFTYHSEVSAVSHAIASRALDRTAVSPRLLEYLESGIQLHQELRALEGKDDDEDG